MKIRGVLNLQRIFLKRSKGFGNGRKTYEPLLTEIIPFPSLSLIENPTFLRQKYIKDKLSIRWLAKEMGHSASYVFTNLKCHALWIPKKSCAKFCH